jgi:hypothetical protein
MVASSKEAQQRKPVTASSGAQALQPYISLAMNLHQAGMHGDEQQRAPAYVDRSAHALEVQLVSLGSAGDDAAFTTLVTRYHPAVFRWSLTFAWDSDEAEDIGQEVFVRAHRQLSPQSGPAVSNECGQERCSPPGAGQGAERFEDQVMPSESGGCAETLQPFGQ